MQFLANMNVLGLCVCISVAAAYTWEDMNLPDEHIPYFFTNNPSIKQECKNDPQCPYKAHLDSEKCWGYEDQCEEKNRMFSPQCSKSNEREKNQLAFWKYADFGYVKSPKDEMYTICKPNSQGESSLKCSPHMRYCKAENIYINLKNADIFNNKHNKNNRFRNDFLKPGDFGGKCSLDYEQLKQLGDEDDELQSWYPELKVFDSLDFNPGLDKEHCDVTFTKPTIIVKLDAGVSMYHHFCDFVNLYASQHINNSFNRDVQVVMWHMSSRYYPDFFKEIWDVFSAEFIPIVNYNGKTICVKDAMFPLLPRMVGGLYDNVPPTGAKCQKSSMFRAFSQHILHRLNLIQQGPIKRKLRVTLVNRNIKHRRIANAKELEETLSKSSDYEVKVVDFNPHRMPFLDQLEVSHNSDILIGVHDSGLTHLLFQPDWATLFELYDYADNRSYPDLARLRGVNYVTWTDMEKVKEDTQDPSNPVRENKKYANYLYDVTEFMRIVDQAGKKVRSHPAFKAAWKAKWGSGDVDGVEERKEEPEEEIKKEEGEEIKEEAKIEVESKKKDEL